MLAHFILFTLRHRRVCISPTLKSATSDPHSHRLKLVPTQSVELSGTGDVDDLLGQELLEGPTHSA